MVLLDSLISSRLKDIEKKLNYHASGKLEIYITPYQQLSTGTPEVDQTGHVQYAAKKIFLSTDIGPKDLVRQFTLQASEALVMEMMYGGSVQDKIRSANLINLPDWVLPGLYHYIEEDWSAKDDGVLRYLNEHYGLANFNSIPKEYNKIVGASFWKYMEHEYGASAIPTVLYMGRLTRKFNSALYYAYQVSLTEVYGKWSLFYDRIYIQDLRKSLPKDGHFVSYSDVVALAVVSETSYISVEHTLLGLCLFEKSENNKKIVLHRIPEVYRVSKPLAGNMVIDEKSIWLLLHTADGEARLMEYANGEVKYHSLGFGYSQLTSSDGKLYVLQSGLSTSSIYTYSKEKLDLIVAEPYFIESLAVSGDQMAWVQDELVESKVWVSYGKTKERLLSSPFGFHQLIWADTNHLLYNSASNGVWNGKICNIRDGIERSLTDYRSNILWHQYTKDFFAEYVYSGKYSRLLISDYIAVKDFYIYDSISRVSMNSVVPKESERVGDIAELESDSLMSYVFQSPVSPAMDFVLSDYDSLARFSEEVNFKLIQPDPLRSIYHTFSSSLAISSQPPLGQDFGLSTVYSALLPNRLNLSSKIVFSNTLETKSTQIGFFGLMRQGERDVYVSHTQAGRRLLSFRFLHRHRLLFPADTRLSYDHNAAEIGLLSTSQGFFRFSHLLSFSDFRSRALLINEESTQIPSEEHQIVKYEFHTSLALVSELQSIKANAAVSPYFSSISSDFASTFTLDLAYSRQISPKFRFQSNLRAASSIGEARTFFLVGGSSTDYLVHDEASPFSSAYTPGLFSNLFGVRGFNANYRNGNTAVVGTAEIATQIVNLIYDRPISNEFFRNLEASIFFDVGTAFYGNGFYATENVINQKQVESTTGSVVANINVFKNPTIFSLGSQFKTTIYGYHFGLSYAVGKEEEVWQRPMVHLHFGLSL